MIAPRVVSLLCACFSFIQVKCFLFNEHMSLPPALSPTPTGCLNCDEILQTTMSTFSRPNIPTSEHTQTAALKFFLFSNCFFFLFSNEHRSKLVFNMIFNKPYVDWVARRKKHGWKVFFVFFFFLENGCIKRNEMRRLMFSCDGIAQPE